MHRVGMQCVWSVHDLVWCLIENVTPLPVSVPGDAAPADEGAGDSAFFAPSSAGAASARTLITSAPAGVLLVSSAAVGDGGAGAPAGVPLSWDKNR